MKIVHILGRGIEGCGVTRFTLELKDWALSQGWNYTVYAPTDKKWTRASSHYLDENIKQWKWGNKPARDRTGEDTSGAPWTGPGHPGQMVPGK